MRRSGATLIEILMTVGIITIMGSMVIPSYRNYKIRSDLYLSVEQTTQLLHRAQLLSQSGQERDTWGVHPAEGTLFHGASYDTRDIEFDEGIEVPPSVTVSGVAEVTFSRVYGVPNIEGDIIFTSLNGEQRTIIITKDLVLRAPTLQGSSSNSSISSISSSASSQCRWWHGCGSNDDDDHHGDDDDQDDEDDDDDDIDDN